MRSRNHHVPLAELQHHVIDPANPSCALDDGVEYRLHIRGRAADDAEHFRRGRLMFERFAQFRSSGVLPLQRLGKLLRSSAIVCACLARVVFTTARRGFIFI